MVQTATAQSMGVSRMRRTELSARDVEGLADIVYFVGRPGSSDLVRPLPHRRDGDRSLQHEDRQRVLAAER
jgi:hypothetical protein